MLYKTILGMLDDGNPTAGESAGSTPSTETTSPQGNEVKSAADVFDAASKHFFGQEDEDTATEDESEVVEGTEEGEPSEGTETENNQFTDENPETQEQKQQKKVNEFAPYSFKGKVFGKEKVQEFKSKRELDDAIAKGLAAPQLYKMTKEYKTKLAELEPDATWARDAAAMAKENPAELLDLIADELISDEHEDVIAEWIYNRYERFAKLAKMTPEEREREKRLREAERIIEERRYLAQEAERVKQERERSAAEDEKRQFTSWRQSEAQKWLQKIPTEYRESVDAAMRAVVAVARARLDAGHKVTFKDMSKELDKILAPYLHAKSPTQARREAGQAMEAKKNQATAALQGATRQPSQSRSTQGAPVKSAGDVFDRFAQLVASGKMKLRN